MWTKLGLFHAVWRGPQASVLTDLVHSCEQEGKTWMVLNVAEESVWGPCCFVGWTWSLPWRASSGWDGVHKSSKPCLLDWGTRKINKEQEVREREWRDRDHMSVSWSVHSVYSVQLSWSLLAASSSKLWDTTPMWKDKHDHSAAFYPAMSNGSSDAKELSAWNACSVTII